MKTGFKIAIPGVVLLVVFSFFFLWSPDEARLGLEKLTCEDQINNNKPPTIYNVTPADGEAIVRWYQSPQTIDGINCGFPQNYKMTVALSPVSPPFVFEKVIPASFRGAYEITGLEPNTTYYVSIHGDWGTKIIKSEVVEFTTLAPGSEAVASNPIEAAKDEMSRNVSEKNEE